MVVGVDVDVDVDVNRGLTMVMVVVFDTGDSLPGTCVLPAQPQVLPSPACFSVTRSLTITSGTGQNSADFEVFARHSLLSFIVRIVPSPDWFVGVDSLNLCEGDQWKEQLSLDLYPWDAGTDSGFTFSSPNFATIPQDTVTEVLCAVIAGLLHYLFTASFVNENLTYATEEDRKTVSQRRAFFYTGKVEESSSEVKALFTDIDAISKKYSSEITKTGRKRSGYATTIKKSVVPYRVASQSCLVSSQANRPVPVRDRPLGPLVPGHGLPNNTMSSSQGYRTGELSSQMYRSGEPWNGSGFRNPMPYNSSQTLRTPISIPGLLHRFEPVADMKKQWA
ncbi:UNVERIFIED_CONTAM: hypothetical protein FKN15_005125 [Acipenser sinensis]